MEQRKLNMIDLERQKLNLLLHDQSDELQKWTDEQERRKNEEQKKEDDANLQNFLEEKLKDKQADRREADTTRRLANAAKDDPSTENLVNLMTKVITKLHTYYLVQLENFEE